MTRLREQIDSEAMGSGSAPPELLTACSHGSRGAQPLSRADEGCKPTETATEHHVP